MRILASYRIHKGAVELCGVSTFVPILPIHCRRVGNLIYRGKEHDVYCELSAFGYRQIYNTRVEKELLNEIERLLKKFITFPLVTPE